MGKVTVEFTLHREFVKEGEYNVTRKSVVAKITVTRIQNIDSMRKMMGQLETMGKVETTHDYHGVVNISRVRITLPYHMQFGEPLEFKRECIPFLNRLIEAVKYNTNAYWITPVTEHDILYFDIIENIDDTGNPRRGFSDVAQALIFPVQVIDQTNVQKEISYILENEVHIPRFALLLLDSYNYFASSQFNLAIITANTALEIFIEKYLKSVLSRKFQSQDQLENKLSLALEGKNLHSKVRRNFFKNQEHDVLLRLEPVYEKFHAARNHRGKAVHSEKELERDESFNGMKGIIHFTEYLQGNFEELAQYILMKY
jgi:hypothetical protein